MPQRSLREFRPHLERLESKQPLSANAAAHALVRPVPRASAAGPNIPPAGLGIASVLADNQTGMSVPTDNPGKARPATGINLDRVTNPSRSGDNARLIPPYGHDLVQSQRPIPGRVYNLLFLSVYNATGRSFTARDNFTVRTSNTPAGVAFPVLTGNQTWPAGTRIVFYLVSNKYYPLHPTQSAGFQFNFIDPSTPRVTAIPGPSGIAVRIRYNPATIDKVLDYYVTSGPGAIGHQFGIPDTALWEILPTTVKVIAL